MKITVIILTYNEELHIERCIRSAQLITDSIYVVDSNSSDSTIDIATSLGVRLLNRNFDSHSQQFNWALEAIDHCEWVIRMDADEYLTNELAVNIREAVELNSLAIHGYAFPRRIAFLGKLIRFGGVFPVEIVRMFRYRFGKIESRLMDEHRSLLDKVARLENDLKQSNHETEVWRLRVAELQSCRDT